MAGYDIYIYGSNNAGVYPDENVDWLKLSISGLNYENWARGEAKASPLGGYLHPRSKEKTIVIKCRAVATRSWFSYIDTLADHFTKPFIYFRRGTYPSEIASSLPENSRIIPTGRSIEHTYDNGTKSIDVECVIYE